MLETSIVVESRVGELGGRELDLLIHRAQAAVVPVDAEQIELGRAAWRRYGMARHPAGLNLSDCFAYALSAATGEPLLYKGGDFARTDVAAVGG